MKMLIAYTISYIASYLLAASGHYYLSGAVLILCAAAIYLSDYFRTANLISLGGLFTLGFLGGEGIACLKLSYLQTDWNFVTWASFYIAFMAFRLSYEIPGKYDLESRIHIPARKGKTDFRKLYYCILVLTAVSAVAFLSEAVILGYIPLFLRGVPHAYSYFHISGVHYFTVSAVLVPSFSIIWLLKSTDRTKKETCIILAADAAAFLIPVLCVSRFQFASAIVLVVFTYLVLNRTIRLRYVLIAAGILIPVYLILSISRSHDVDYLNTIFEMKGSYPILISHPYIYIANNYDNFNAMVCGLTEHTFGLRMLFPVFALTGLKFIFPQLVSFPLYVTKTELTTLTIFYDAYYDFGVPGVFFFALFLGILCFCIEKVTVKDDDPAAAAFYAQFAVYMALSFFTTWFSNPTTWFYFGITLIVYLISTFTGRH